MLGAYPMSAVPMSSIGAQYLLRAAAGAYALTGQAAGYFYIDYLRLRARDFSDFQFRVRDESEGYW